MTDPDAAASMAELRLMIDALDQRLLDLLAERKRCIDRAIALKQAEGLPARIDARVREVQARVRAGAAARDLDPGLAAAVWEVLIEWSIAREERVLGRDAG